MPTDKDRKIFIEVLKTKCSNEEFLQACKDTKINPNTGTMTELRYLRTVLESRKAS